MSRIPRIGRRLTMPARRAKRRWQPAPPTASASQTADSTSADKYPAVRPVSFRRIVDIPYAQHAAHEVTASRSEPESIPTRVEEAV